MNRLLVTHVPPRHVSKRCHWLLAVCFVLSLALIGVLALVTRAPGQTLAEHPFPFKTVGDVAMGTSGWSSDGPPQLRFCPNSPVIIQKFQLRSGADSIWVIGIGDGLVSAAYFPPGAESPVAIVWGHLDTSGGGGGADNPRIIVDKNEPFDPERHIHPCDRWTQKTL